MANWYAVQTKARQEAIAQQHLANQSFDTFLPRLRAHKRLRGKWQTVIEPLFPGYLFVQLDIATQNSAPIRSTRGVVRLVRLGDRLQAVPTALVAELQDAQRHDGDAIAPEDFLNPGDEVTFSDGPFAGLTAIFQARSGQERVIVLLNLLGQCNRVRVPLDHLALRA
jgi:transcriptional antiterminator RfaH